MADPIGQPDPIREVVDDSGAGRFGSAPRMPMWAKVFAIAFLVLMALIVAMMVSGHGPGQHMAGMGLVGPPMVAGVAKGAVNQL